MGRASLRCGTVLCDFDLLLRHIIRTEAILLSRMCKPHVLKPNNDSQHLDQNMLHDLFRTPTTYYALYTGRYISMWRHNSLRHRSETLTHLRKATDSSKRLHVAKAVQQLCHCATLSCAYNMLNMPGKVFRNTPHEVFSAGAKIPKGHCSYFRVTTCSPGT